MEARLRAIEDELALRRLVNTYFSRADQLDWRGWADLFAEDGTFTPPGAAETLRGRSQIGKVVGEQWGGVFQGTQHFITNLEIEVCGDTATAFGNLIFAAVADLDQPSRYLFMGGRYTWSFKRVAGEWLVARAGNTFVWNDTADEEVANE